jgi:hypothetical protein
MPKRFEFECPRRNHRLRIALAFCLGLACTPIASTYADDVEFDFAVSMGDVQGASGASIAMDAKGNIITAEIGTSIAVDASGNVYTTGSFNGTVDFDPGPGTAYLTSAGTEDIFVSKLDTSGNFLWAKSMGGTGGQFGVNDVGEDIAVDGSGNVYTTGYFWGTVDFDPGAGTVILTSAGGEDIFVQKLDTSGNFVWAKAMGGARREHSRSIAVDGSGNVYTTGRFVGIADFDPGPGTANLASAPPSDQIVTEGEDIFVSKLDASGNFVWAKSMGAEGGDGGTSIAVDGSGNVYTTGYFWNTVDFDPGAGSTNLTSAEGQGIFVTKWDTSGTFVWAKAVSTFSGTLAYDSLATDNAVDALGNVYTTGHFEYTLDFDPGAGTAYLTPAGGGSRKDIFVQKLDTSGNFVWAKAMGGTETDWGKGIAVDGAGNVYTTGGFRRTADFDPGTGTADLTALSVLGWDIFVSKLDTSGNYIWAKAMGGVESVDGTSIAIDGWGSVYTTGPFWGTVDFDPGLGVANLSTRDPENMDLFVSKLSPDTTPPTADSITPATTGPTNAGSVAFTVVFSEPVVNFDSASDVLVTHSGTAHTGVGFSKTGHHYTVTVTGITGDGSFTLAANLGSDVQDPNRNLLASSVTSAPVVIDNTAPLIIRLGDAELNIAQCSFYTDLGANAFDNLDGNVTADIVTNNPVDIAVPGAYTVSYNVTDAAGNAAATVTRVVTVTAPENPHDVNDDGHINIIDAQFIINAILQLPVPDGYGTDVNGDCITNILDLFEIVEIIIEG